jgi:ABC-type multidrug transport system fused ATPase/permease subunit
VTKNLGVAEKELDTIADDAQKLIRRFRQPASGSWRHEQEQPVPASASEDTMEAARKRFASLRRLIVPRLFKGFNPFVLALLAVGGAAAWRMSQNAWAWSPQATNTALLAGGIFVGAAILLYVVALARVRPVARHLQEDLAAARAALASARNEAKGEREAGIDELRHKRERDVVKAKDKYNPILDEIGTRREQHVSRIHEKYPALIKELETKRVTELKEAEETHDTKKREIVELHETTHRQARERHDLLTRELRERHEQAWQHLIEQWTEGSTRIQRTFDEAIRMSAELFPPWDDPQWQGWDPPMDFAPAIRFGELKVEAAKLPGGVPVDQRLQIPWPEVFGLPAAIAFPDRCSLLLETGDEGGADAVAVLQTVMFRLLTTLPPGKVRFTIMDPVGLGQNFAGFMHLADSLESLVTDRIWTEPRHIEQRLTDITDHMENVIQKYLRNEYETIAQYNEQAGEIAEPYRFLVIADFPGNFSDSAAKRLASIIASGSRCGVYTLIGMDRRQPLPRGVELADLRRDAIILSHDDGQFVWKDEDFESLPLSVDPPPEPDFMIEKIRQVGEAARDASRVEVPFDIVTPSTGERWTGDASSELRVPLGRLGAKSLQHVSLGRGTSQHMLIAGKTGSGKSTLLHVLITNIALWFRPDEVELYLVDFKKGVEFKAYATHELPHARAVAIESDREFGLSILQRLDQELKRRGAMYRDLGVQDLAGFRRSRPDEPMPRILLIIDEFQEFFTSTMGQMAVRIALQCSEADSYLILSEDNSAARLLARPGEAIYNDASGRVEGNSPFQIVWLNDSVRDEALQDVSAMATAASYRPPTQQIVFEGNAASDVRSNRGLQELLDREHGEPSVPAVAAWLGDAVAIKDPTSAVFRRQSGSNLLLVGQREEAALASLAVGVLSAAARHRPGAGNGVAGKTFYLLDGLPADSPHAGLVDRLAEVLGPSARVVGRRDLDEVLQTILDEVTRRDEQGVQDPPSVYLCIFGLQRYRDLRQSEDFSFGSDDKPPSPDKLFSQILRDGPPVGVHSLIWCDTATNVDRAFDRQTMREFDMRVVFQMSPSDSTNLIDSPAANKLGMRHALFYSEEKGVLEKFRPYGMLDEEWLKHVSTRLRVGVPVIETTASAPPPPPPEPLAEPTTPDADTAGDEFGNGM